MDIWELLFYSSYFRGQLKFSIMKWRISTSDPQGWVWVGQGLMQTPSLETISWSFQETSQAHAEAEVVNGLSPPPPSCLVPVFGGERPSAERSSPFNSANKLVAREAGGGLPTFPPEEAGVLLMVMTE